MKTAIKSFGMALACGILSCAGAAPVEIGTLPQWVYADTEVSTNCPMRLLRNSVEDVRFSLEFTGGESNNVEVAFGRDVNTNGILELPERGLSVGWDCGSWFLRGLDGDTLLCESVTTNAEKRLDFSLHVSGCRARRLACRENNVLLEWDLGATVPSWMFDPQWNMVRIAVRGVDGNCESFSATVTVDGTTIRIR